MYVWRRWTIKETLQIHMMVHLQYNVNVKREQRWKECNHHKIAVMDNPLLLKIFI